MKAALAKGLPELAEPLTIDDACPLGMALSAGLDQSATARAVAEAIGAEHVDRLPTDARPSARFMDAIPIGYARRHKVMGLASDNGAMPVLVANVAELQQVDVLARHLSCPIKPIIAPASEITTLINSAYEQRTGQTQVFVEGMDRTVLDEVRQMEGREDLLDTSGRAPVIKLVNLIFFEAVQQMASDIHVQPYEEHVVVRFRIDGVLFDAFELPKSVQDEMTSRIKVMGRMNIAEKRLAQDGRATVQVGDRMIDLRIASLPTSFGERVVIRLLDKSARLYTLGELGMEPGELAKFRELIGIEHGLILVTGPTGSGKSTTLYAALQEINATERNVLTLEDPIEYQLPGISQTQVSDRKGMTFASGLRHVLRQDPDIIMVGEIRDHETAVMAIQSALTGHLVFSTLHTNDAATAVTRLLDLGIEPYLVASSVAGVLAQRLVRRVCPACAERHTPQPGALDRLTRGLQVDADATIATAQGCEQCRQTGYRGRMGIFELLAIDDALRQRIQQCHTAAEIRSAAIAAGMRTLLDSGVTRVLQQSTTIDEVLRVTAGKAQ
jgi:general secretion pathway protein E